jgi:RNA polymerase sigma-70 factor (ECF subfamily)
MLAQAVYVGEVLRCLDVSGPDDIAGETHLARQSLHAGLIDRLRADDQQAFEALLTEFAPALEAYAYRLTGSRDAACDLVQDVFAHLWEQRDAVRIRGSVRAYLYTAIRHRAIDVRRRERTESARWITASDADAPAGMGRSGTPPDIELERREIAARVATALDTLPPRVREAAMLRWVDGLSRVEVANVMGVAIGTVKNQLGHAAEVVRALLRDLRQPEGRE